MGLMGMTVAFGVDLFSLTLFIKIIKMCKIFNFS